MNIAVIGGGPAGLFAAIYASRKGGVTLYEKMAHPGRKLLITGAGQCNITCRAKAPELLVHYRGNQKFLRHALYAFTPDDVLSFFEKRGVVFETTSAGKVFPADRKATSVLEVLLAELKIAHVCLLRGTAVTELGKAENDFIVKSSNGEAHYDRVIIATGGLSYPETGCSGDGFLMAKSLGHTLMSPLPALVDVHIENFGLGECAGESFREFTLSHWRDGKKIASYQGDLLISHKGFSGPVILNNSRFFKKGDQLVPDFSRLGENFENKLLDNIKRNGKRSIRNILREFEIPVKLIDTLLKNYSINGDVAGAELSREIRKKIVEMLQKQRYTIAATGGFKKAMVTAGGVSLKEINPKTMESRICPGLFFAGEVMDVDGDTGGYNLQAAWSTGYLAGTSL